jgi:uncharacterized membrane protein YkoI
MKTMNQKKMTVVILLSLALNINLIAQDSQIPKEVLASFQSKFPNAADLKWEVKKELYKAEFKIGTRANDVWLDKVGIVKKHKQDFPKKELPEVIRKKIESDFSGFKIDDADKIEENGEVFYEVDIKGATEERKLLFTAAGAIKENSPKK